MHDASSKEVEVVVLTMADAQEEGESKMEQNNGIRKKVVKTKEKRLQLDDFKGVELLDSQPESGKKSVRIALSPQERREEVGTSKAGLEEKDAAVSESTFKNAKHTRNDSSLQIKN